MCGAGVASPRASSAACSSPPAHCAGGSGSARCRGRTSDGRGSGTRGLRLDGRHGSPASGAHLAWPASDRWRGSSPRCTAGLVTAAACGALALSAAALAFAGEAGVSLSAGAPARAGTPLAGGLAAAAGVPSDCGATAAHCTSGPGVRRPALAKDLCGRAACQQQEQQQHQPGVTSCRPHGSSCQPGSRQPRFLALKVCQRHSRGRSSSQPAAGLGPRQQRQPCSTERTGSTQPGSCGTGWASATQLERGRCSFRLGQRLIPQGQRRQKGRAQLKRCHGRPLLLAGVRAYRNTYSC